MRFLGIIWEDIRRLNSRLSPVVKIAGLILVLILIYWTWYQGMEYWGERVTTKYRSRPQRGVLVLGALTTILLVYLVSVIERFRKK
jgi:hypothetical protein